MSVVVLVLRGDNGEVLNAKKVAVEAISGTNEVASTKDLFHVFPTICTHGDVYIEKAANASASYQAILFNSKGQAVTTQKLIDQNITTFSLPENLPSDYYYLNIFDRNSSHTYSIVIVK
jgi:hypothetical protein